ncbi:predicted protein [Pyrenophora tritici-repentis Pt-1C-BFP]|uniref:Uncharacterized protein n=1 Tax=Pyrenophora tritici-repentis (strain Pt-1C-BFP) TaxID=426418 RepID=B2W4C6_PYRTR|nr:uncharacterized protein PTRG_04476 [Pyrenophora tritici-repentis Pt-1C-BFP]EDU47383.1 predicted protein [Pyrenophora tritici-repentis Pt-1C-BFP]
MKYFTILLFLNAAVPAVAWPIVDNTCWVSAYRCASNPRRSWFDDPRTLDCCNHIGHSIHYYQIRQATSGTVCRGHPKLPRTKDIKRLHRRSKSAIQENPQPEIIHGAEETLGILFLPTSSSILQIRAVR